MREYPEPRQATDATTLEERIMSQGLAKTEQEWWAKREIENLRKQLDLAESRIAEAVEHCWHLVYQSPDIDDAMVAIADYNLSLVRQTADQPKNAGGGND